MPIIIDIVIIIIVITDMEAIMVAVIMLQIR